MSLYEVLDQFVGAGVLACAGVVGVEMPAGAPLDGAAFSARLRELRLNEPYGAALDALAHAVWFARERHGIPLDTAERHASALAGLMAEVRLSARELIEAAGPVRTAITHPAMTLPAAGATTPSARVAALWLASAAASGALTRAKLDAEICRFLIAEMLALVIDQPRLLSTVAPALTEHCRMLAATTQIAPPPAQPAPPQPAPRPSSIATITASAVPAAKVSNLPLPAAVAEVQARHRMPDGALRRFQAILAQQSMSAEQRLARLDELGAWLVATVAHLRKPGNDAPELRHIKIEAAASLEAGDLERAMDRLKAVREHMREGRRRIESRIAEELHSLRQQMVEEAAATARLGELALARMDLDAAADHFADAAGHLPASEPALELEYRQRRAEALAAKAETSGEIRVVEAAAQAFRSCRHIIVADTAARTRVRINVGLGDMLVALGARRETETTELEEAVAAYTDAIAAIDRAGKPMQWALVQLSQAAALIDIGLRRDRDHYWKLAATALMPALDVFESRGAGDLAEAARAKLRTIATGIGEQPQQALLMRPARSA